MGMKGTVHGHGGVHGHEGGAPWGMKGGSHGHEGGGSMGLKGAGVGNLRTHQLNYAPHMYQGSVGCFLEDTCRAQPAAT